LQIVNNNNRRLALSSSCHGSSSLIIARRVADPATQTARNAWTLYKNVDRDLVLDDLTCM
jgi:hypothetical protein